MERLSASVHGGGRRWGEILGCSLRHSEPLLVMGGNKRDSLGESSRRSHFQNGIRLEVSAVPLKGGAGVQETGQT